jgi:RNA polymerase sigma-70 factor (ECF subfamily)
MPSNDLNPISDSALLDRYRRGDDDAATELYVKYAGRIQDLADAETSGQLRRQVEPADVVQSVFRTFFRRVSEGFFDIPPGDEIWNLFLVLALNKIRQSARFHSRKKRDLKRTTSFDVAMDLGRDDQVPLTILRLTINELLEKVSPLHRRMIEMRIQGYELDEIATATRRSSRTIERVLKQFRDKLSRQIHGK